MDLRQFQQNEDSTPKVSSHVLYIFYIPNKLFNTIFISLKLEQQDIFVWKEINGDLTNSGQVSLHLTLAQYLEIRVEK